MAALEAEKHGAPSRQVTEFKGTFGPFGLYLDGPEIEDDDPDFDVMRFRDYDDEEDENHVDDPRQALITHIRQVRHSFGFDVDVVVPSWAVVYYFPIDLSDPVSRDSMIKGAKVAIHGINDDMKGKIYELVEVVKAVYCRNMSKYLTITAKKLDEEEGQVVTIIQAIVKEYPEIKVRSSNTGGSNPLSK